MQASPKFVRFSLLPLFQVDSNWLSHPSSRVIHAYCYGGSMIQEKAEMYKPVSKKVTSPRPKAIGRALQRPLTGDTVAICWLNWTWQNTNLLSAAYLFLYSGPPAGSLPPPQSCCSACPHCLHLITHTFLLYCCTNIYWIYHVCSIYTVVSERSTIFYLNYWNSFLTGRFIPRLDPDIQHLNRNNTDLSEMQIRSGDISSKNQFLIALSVNVNFSLQALSWSGTALLSLLLATLILKFYVAMVKYFQLPR